MNEQTLKRNLTIIKNSGLPIKKVFNFGYGKAHYYRYSINGSKELRFDTALYLDEQGYIKKELTKKYSNGLRHEFFYITKKGYELINLIK